jgi:hypothetical protein
MSLTLVQELHLGDHTQHCLIKIGNATRKIELQMSRTFLALACALKMPMALWGETLTQQS